MKKILNDPFNYVDEMLEGLCLAHPDLYRQTGESGRVIARSSEIPDGKVGIVTGGGSGHLPVFRELAIRNPNTQLVVDHLGLTQPHVPPVPQSPFAALDTS